MRAPAADSPFPPKRWLLALVIGVGLVAFLQTLGGGFLADDFVYVVRFRTFAWGDWPRLFVREWSEGVWGFQLKELRPFAALSFMVDARQWGAHATGYRLTNLALHLAVTTLVLRLAWRYTRRNRFATAVAALVFALQPAHAETVAWITGRVDLLATFCALGFWLAAENFSEYGSRRRLILSGALLFAGVFSKELCLTAPLLLLAFWLLVEPRASHAQWLRRGSVLMVVAAVIVIYAICRRTAFGNDATPPSAVWVDEGAWRRQASYVGWLVPILPFTKKTEWAATPSASSLRAAWLLVAAFALTGAGVAIARRAMPVGRMLFFTGVWYVVTVGGLLVVGYFSPRHLYFPTTGLAVGAGLLVAAIGRPARLRVAVGAGLIGWSAAAHVVALQPWRENGRVSREVIAALNADLARAPDGTLALVAVPEAARGAWLWSWSSPQALGAPFVNPPLAPAQVIERPGNYFRPEDWAKDRQPVATVRAASGAVALTVDAAGRVEHRRVTGKELQAHLNALASLAGDGITVDEWTAWVTTLITP